MLQCHHVVLFRQLKVQTRKQQISLTSVIAIDFHLYMCKYLNYFDNGGQMMHKLSLKYVLMILL